MAGDNDYKNDDRVKLSKPLKKAIERAKRTRLKVGLIAALLFVVSLGIFFAVIFSEGKDGSPTFSNLPIAQDGNQPNVSDVASLDVNSLNGKNEDEQSLPVSTTTSNATSDDFNVDAASTEDIQTSFEDIIVISTDASEESTNSNDVTNVDNSNVSTNSSSSKDVAVKSIDSNSQSQTNQVVKDEGTDAESNSSFKDASDNDLAKNSTSIALGSSSIDASKYLFVSAFGVSIFDTPGGKVLDTLKYASYVQKLDETKFGTETFTKVAYRTPDGKIIGWVRSAFLSNSLKPIAGSGYEDISFEPVSKTFGRISDVRGIYLTRTSVNTKEKIANWISFAKKTNLNAFVIDVKDDDGFMLFTTSAAAKFVPKANEDAFYSKEEMKSVVSELKAAGIYVIARIVAFKDPSYARAHMDRAIVYKDTGNPYMGIYKVPWASAYDKQLWEYNVSVAKEAAEVGFDEIQYDYVRFPELTEYDRNRVNLRKTGDDSFAESIQKFLIYSKKELAPYNVPLAADVFGLVSTAVDDLGIGQYWEAISNVVDYICPMVYPSHYANGSFGLSIPDQFPYETVYRSVLDGVRRNCNIPTPARIRPWIQSFTATWVKGHITYDENAIRKEIKALKDLGINEYMFWNASNRYVEMWYN
ncbi:MAG: putative glycoside hydrolase [Thermotogaceae bacterium]|nr:putative glycoside hydrolase [Thermotogaceae bacterium]